MNEVRTMKKWMILISIFILSIMTGCGKNEASDEPKKELGKDEIYAYFVNLDKTDVYTEHYKIPKNKDTLDIVRDVVVYLSNSESENCISPIPSAITYVNCQKGRRVGSVEVAFRILYDEVDAETLLFFKGCLTKTLLQLEDVSSVVLTFTDVMNPDVDTATVSETFDVDSFTMAFGNESGYEQSGTIVLYFANETGETLKEYRKKVEISNNTSLARLVVESLIDGPKREGYLATLSDKVTIRNLSVKDGICYLDLSDEFYDTSNTLKNDIIVYSVVNSLAELPTVSKVQFLRNGEKQEFFRETLPYDGIFERSLDMIEQNTTEATTQEPLTEE